MANYTSSIIRIRKSENERQHNKHYLSLMKTSIKKVLASTDKEIAQKLFNDTQKLLDKLAVKGIIHPNKAANQKSRLALFVNKL